MVDKQRVAHFPDPASERFEDHLELFRLDAARWLEPEEIGDTSDLTVRNIARMLFLYQSFRATTWFRLASWCRIAGIRGVPGAIQRRMLRLYGLEIPISTLIGGGLYIGHPVGVTITCERLGSNATIIGLNTIGYRNVLRWPRLGDRLYLGTGAKVLGDLEVGDNVLVGANAVVVKDVPSNTTVVGIPARPIDRSS